MPPLTIRMFRQSINRNDTPYVQVAGRKGEQADSRTYVHIQ